MKYCPVCGRRFDFDIEMCPECDVELLDEEIETCQFCGSEIEPGLLYCPNCGKVFFWRIEDEDEDIECENHFGKTASGVCVICGKPLCNDCAVEIDGKVYCKEENHRDYEKNWEVIYRTPVEYEAEMIKANLESAGIPCVVFSQKDHAYFMTIGFGDVKILVPKDKKELAIRIIEDMKLRNEEE